MRHVGKGHTQERSGCRTTENKKEGRQEGVPHQCAADGPLLLEQALASHLPAQNPTVGDEVHLTTDCFLEERNED